MTKTRISFSPREQRWCSFSTRTVLVRYDEQILVQNAQLSTESYHPGKRCKNSVCTGFMDCELMSYPRKKQTADLSKLDRFWHNGQEWRCREGSLLTLKLALLTPDGKAYILEKE